MIAELQLPFVVRTADIDESPRQQEPADAYVSRVTLAKLEAVCRAVREERLASCAVMTADTAVIVDQQILGKPQDDAHALSMLRLLSGRTHQVKSAYALRKLDSNKLVTRLVSTDVRMRQSSDAELRAYIATGEGRDKAGSYAIQGRASYLVESISGSHSNVIGLPLCEFVRDMEAMGLIGELFAEPSS